MNGMFVDQLDDVFVAEVIANEVDIVGDLFRSVVLVLQECESGPFGMVLPKLQDGLCSFQGASSGKVEDRVLAPWDFLVVEVAGSEPGEVAGRMNFTEDFQRMFALAENVIDFLEAWNVALGETFLVRNEKVDSG